MTKSWLGILAVLWLAFLAAVVVFIIFVARRPDQTAAQEPATGVQSVQAETEPPPQTLAATDQEPEPRDEPAATGTADEGEDDAPEGAAETREASAEGATSYFTSDQANRGQEAYNEHCARCHSSDLQGQGGNPALVGESFLANYQTVGELFEYTRTQMPLDNPGSLEDETYADITAYVLQQNDFPEGEEELPADREQLEELPLDPEAAGDAAEEAEEGPAPEDQPEGEADTEEAEGEQATEAAAAGQPTAEAQPEEAPADDESDGEAEQPTDTDESAETAEAQEPAAADAEAEAESETEPETEAEPAEGTDQLEITVDAADTTEQVTVEGSEPVTVTIEPTGEPAGTDDTTDDTEAEEPTASEQDDEPEAEAESEDGAETQESEAEEDAAAAQASDQEPAEEGEAPGSATAELQDVDGNTIGTASFSMTDDGLVSIQLNISGFEGASEGEHGIHIHEVGECEPDFQAAGGHFNPTGDQHGFLNPAGPHAGDLPNIRFDAQGNASYEVTTEYVTLDDGERGLLGGDGTALVIHANPDDYTTDPSGESGDRIACGVITAQAEQQGQDELQTQGQQAAQQEQQDQQDQQDQDEQADEQQNAQQDEEQAQQDQQDQQQEPETADEGEASTDEAAEEGDAEQQTETADSEEAQEPQAGESWLEIHTEPANVTINVLGPEGYVQRIAGAQTLRGLEPGRYIIAASRGHQSATADVMVEAGETARVSLVLGEFARSEDVPEEPAVPATEVPAIPDEPVDPSVDAESEEEAGAEESEEAQEAEGAEEGSEEEGSADASTEDEASMEGYFTSEQADQGQEVYDQHCVECHGQDLQGQGGNPALVGEDFLAQWDTVGELFEYTRSNMPLDNPGSLSDEQYADVTAFILQQNDLPEGDEELPPDQEQLDGLPLEMQAAEGGSADGAGESAGTSEEDGSDAASEEENGAGEATDGSGDEDAGDEGAAAQESQEVAEDATQAERGAQAYAEQCARCHGENLQGNVAPALAGPVFLERWGGHPVDWLYFQARTSMPPHAPGSLDDQTYTDILVYALSESDLLEGHESFDAGSEEFLQFVIARGDNEQQRLQEQIEALREELHAPHDEEPTPTVEPMTPDEEPVRPGTPWEGDVEQPEAEASEETEEAADPEGAEEADEAEGTETPEEEPEPEEESEEGTEGAQEEPGGTEEPEAAPDDEGESDVTTQAQRDNAGTSQNLGTQVRNLQMGALGQQTQETD